LSTEVDLCHITKVFVKKAKRSHNAQDNYQQKA